MMTTLTKVAAAQHQALTRAAQMLTEMVAHGGLDNAAAPFSAVPQNSNSSGARDIDTDHILAVLTWVRDEIVRRYALRHEEAPR